MNIIIEKVMNRKNLSLEELRTNLDDSKHGDLDSAIVLAAHQVAYVAYCNASIVGWGGQGTDDAVIQFHRKYGVSPSPTKDHMGKVFRSPSLGAAIDSALSCHMQVKRCLLVGGLWNAYV